ncbi:hypothetical protein JMA_23530 [Jeotgalibacillus malaysiensis]|uniref:G5 domain-containing protein n=1 Tax=Jeotgalibacillus malaysiensis TaxID=1508404 RepID=A0A0B5AN09_9BACL|nr:VanW family protein [Jeotgalibacillus malaysiensis]AJD91670.1 hypothetical protein JMA_23530 [Jeotgalibacillus malaysiensis]
MKSKVVKIVLLLIPVLLLSFGSILYFSESSAASDKGFTIERMDLREMKLQTAGAIAEWKNRGTITVSYPEGTLEIPRTYFDFDLVQSYKSLEEALQTPWFAFWERNELVTFSLSADLDEDYLAPYSDVINTEMTRKKLIMLAERLVYEDLNTASSKQSGLNEPLEIQMTTGYASKAADLISSVSIPAQSDFSFNETYFNDSEEGLIAASALYQLFLQTGAVISERHAGIRPPDYTKPGLEAAISLEENKDLKIFNQSDFQMMIKASSAGNQLTVTLTTADPERYSIELVQSNLVEPRTIKRFSNLLESGEEQQIQKGEEGFQVQVYQTKLQPSDEVMEDVPFTRDFYAPVPAIIEVSSIAPAVNQPSAASGPQDQTQPEASEQEDKDTSDPADDPAEQSGSNYSNESEIHQDPDKKINENNPK